MLLIFSKMLTIALLLAIGVLVYRLGIVSHTGSREVSALIVKVCCPVMIISNALADESVLTVRTLGTALAVCLFIYLAFIGLGHLVPRVMGVSEKERPSYLMLSLFGNAGFIGIPVSLSVLGPASMPYVIVFNVMYNIFFYTYGHRVISKAVDQPIPIKLSSMVNAGTVSCLIALAIYLFRISVPEVLGQTLSYVSGSTTFLSMLVLGITLATTPMKTVLANPRIYVFDVVRILIFPILLALVLRIFLSDPMMVSALVLMAAMPAGNLAVMLASQYGMNTDTLTSGIITSTLLCLLTIPVVSFFFP
ncbi:MAG: AEC family transporter [Oscillospiraceae bacterium]|nr:AEC family transporter [Oscillospiraceae bacterium]